MKICKACTFLSFLIILLYSCALPPEDEKESLEPDSSTSELPWTGETEKFTINTKEGVHLNDPQEDAGTAYVTIPSSSVRSTRWEFGVRLTFNPSANNYARFYLASSSEILSGDLNGYYIQIGGTKDNVALYRQNGNQSKLLASGRELMKGNNSPKLFIKVRLLDFLDTHGIGNRIYEGETNKRRKYHKVNLLRHILRLYKKPL